MNSHALRHQNLNLACLPISPYPRPKTASKILAEAFRSAGLYNNRFSAAQRKNDIARLRTIKPPENNSSLALLAAWLAKPPDQVIMHKAHTFHTHIALHKMKVSRYKIVQQRACSPSNSTDRFSSSHAIVEQTRRPPPPIRRSIPMTPAGPPPPAGVIRFSAVHMRFTAITPEVHLPTFAPQMLPNSADRCILRIGGIRSERCSYSHCNIYCTQSIDRRRMCRRK